MLVPDRRARWIDDCGFCADIIKMTLELILDYITLRCEQKADCALFDLEDPFIFDCLRTDEVVGMEKRACMSVSVIRWDISYFLRDSS